MVLVAASANAADEPSGSTPDVKTVPPSAAALVKKGMALPGGKTVDELDQKSLRKLKRAENVAEQTAKKAFLRSPEGIASKREMISLDDEINAIYEKYLNLFSESQEKMLREERDRELRALKQKEHQTKVEVKEIEKDSPAYREILEQHLKSQLSKLRGKLKTKQPDEPEKKDDK